MSSKFRGTILASLTVAFVLALGASAQAGTVGVHPNINSGASYGFNGWPNGVNGFSFNLNVGANGGTIMFARTQRLPENVNLDEFWFHANWHNAYSGAQPFGVRLCYGGSGWAGAGGCAGNTYTPLAAVSPVARQDKDLGLGCGIKNAGISSEYRCAGFQFQVNTPQSAGDGTITTNTAILSDYVAPTATNTYNSDQLRSTGWKRGTISGGSSLVDTEGVGLVTGNLYIDGSEKFSQSFACDYAQWVPCGQSKTITPSVATTSLADGPHNAYYSAGDAAANTGQSSTFSFNVDNTNPDTPESISPQSNGDNGWGSTNSFGAQWTNGAEVDTTATQSGLAKVIVDVNPTDTGTQIDPSPITVPIGTTVSGILATKTSVAGITVPTVGQWNLRLRLVDAAGNLSNVGDGSGSDPDSDTTIGFDPNPPAKPLGFANGWISRDELANGYDQSYGYNALPTAKAELCGFAGAIDEDPNGTAGSTINIPGNGATRKWRLPGSLTEAMHYVHIRAISCNGLATPTTETVQAPVDRTDPEGAITGVENGKWYKDGQVATLHGSDVLSGMAPAPSSFISSTSGAYLSYTVNGVGPVDDDAPRGDTANIPISSSGQKSLSFRPVDLAGNKAPAKVVAFGIDADKPTGYINRQNKDRPTRLSAPINDATSGINYAIFYVSGPGTGDTWEALPTSLVDNDGKTVGNNPTSATASARFPDTSLKDGTYKLRVAAFDQAGNQLDTDRYQDGSVATVVNPMRDGSKINAKLFKATRKCGKKHCVVKKCTKKTKGTCYRVHKGKVVLIGGSTNVSAAFRRGAMINGVLADQNGKPLANEDVIITTTEKISGKSVIVGTVKTDGHGIYGIRVPGGMSRTVRATFPGTELREDTSTTATLGTQAKMSLKISKKRAKTGQTVTFSGRVTSFDGKIPAAGKIVALQFYAMKKWRPAVAVAHTNSKGRFKIRYKFDGKRVKAKIIFRVTAPAEDAWGHTLSNSKPTVIRLNR